MSKEIEYVDPNELIIIGLDTDDREEHPLFDERAFHEVDNNLVANILVYGIQRAVLVRREAGNIYVVDGRQRVKAARVAAERAAGAGEYAVKVPVRDTRGDDNRIAGIMVSVNEQRRQDTALEKAFKAVRLLDLLGDEEEVCIAFGRSKTTIRNWLSLAEADPRIHAAIKAGKLSTQAGVEISRLHRDDQVEALEKLTRGMSGGRVSESAAKEYRKQEAEKANAVQNEKITNDDVLGDAKASKKPSTVGASKPKAVQHGVKRTWLRRALKTEAAKTLSDEQVKVLRWFAFGEADAGDWFDDFRFDAETELEKK